MNFMANQIFGEIKVTKNEYTGSSSYSFNWGGGIIRWGRGEWKRPEIFIEESKNVLFASFFLLIRAASSISKTGVVFGKLKNVYTQNKFHFLLNNYFCLPRTTPPPPPTTLLSQPTPRFARIYSLKTNLSTFES